MILEMRRHFEKYTTQHAIYGYLVKTQMTFKFI